MKYTRWLPFPSATLAAVAFFLPWFAISCQSPDGKTQHKIAFSGYHFATGNMPPVVEGMLQLQKQLAGLGNTLLSFLQKKKPKPTPKKNRFFERLRRGFPSFWGALACFGAAALLGLWLGIQGPSPWIRIAGTVAVLAGIACLLYPFLTDFPKPRRGPRLSIKSLSVQLEIGGYLLLSGVFGSLFGFLAAPSQNQTQTLPNSERNAPSSSESVLHTKHDK